MRKLFLTFALALVPFTAQAGVLDFAGRQWGAVQQSLDHHLDTAWKLVAAPQPEAPIPLVEATPKVWIAPLPHRLEVAAPLETKLTLTELPVPRLPAPRVRAAADRGEDAEETVLRRIRAQSFRPRHFRRRQILVDTRQQPL